VQVGELALNDSGAFKIGPFGSSLKKTELVERGIPVAGIENVLPNKFIKTFRRFITARKFEELSDYEILPNDVLVTTMGTIGRAASAPPDVGRAIIDSHLFRMRVDTSRVFPPYLCYALNSDLVASQLARMARGAIMEGLNTKILRECSIPLPVISEQQRIAERLEQSDRLVRTRRYALELTDTFLPATFLELFGCLHENEQKWPFEHLEENAEIASGVAKGQKYGDSKTLEVPYLRVANVQDGYLDLAEIKTIRVPPEDVEALRLQPGDVVMTEGGDFDKLGRGAIWPGGITDCIHQNHIFRVRLNQSALMPRFFAAFLRSGFAKSYFLRCSKQTTNLASINMTQLRATPTPLPPLPLQQKFADLVQQAECLRAVQHEALRQAEHFFQTLLHRAFSVTNSPTAKTEAVLLTKEVT
jgi:type I restriction enzyme S subunit